MKGANSFEMVQLQGRLKEINLVQDPDCNTT